MGAVDPKDLERAGHEAGEDAQAAFRKSLEKRKVNGELVALRLKQLMNWKETKFFQYEGRVSDERRVKDGNIIFKATALTVDVLGLKAPEKVELSGGVTILQPDPIKKREK